MGDPRIDRNNQTHQLVRDALEFIVMPTVTDLGELKRLGQVALDGFKPLVHDLVTKQRRLVSAQTALQEIHDEADHALGTGAELPLEVLRKNMEHIKQLSKRALEGNEPQLKRPNDGQ